MNQRLLSRFEKDGGTVDNHGLNLGMMLLTHVETTTSSIEIYSKMAECMYS
jgi:hypothetical protein